MNPATWRALLSFFFALTGVWGCAPLIVSGRLPEGATVEDLGRSDPTTPFAADDAAQRVAVVRDGELVFLGGTDGPRRLGPAPRALAFSPGARLAASFSSGADSELRVYSPEGALEATARVPGALSALVWLSEDEVAGGAATLERFSFGATRTEYLVRWSGRGEPSLEKIGTATLKPVSLRDQAALAEAGPRLARSPLGDEVSFTQLHDPPAFKPFAAVVLRHLETGTTREVARQPWGSAGALWTDEGDAVWLGDGAHTRRLHWTGRALETLALPGRSLAVSPRGRWVLVDGHLFERGAEVLALAAGAEGTFTARGLLVRSAGRLHLLTAFAETAGAPQPEEASRLRELRRLRTQGLISPADYERLSKGTP